MNVNLIKSHDIEFNNSDMTPNPTNPDVEEMKAKNDEASNLAKVRENLPF